MTPRRVGQQAAIDHVRAVVAARRGRTVWIGVDGFGGAGKTTFAGRLAAAVPGSCVVHVDDFSGPGVPEWDWPRFVEQVRDPLLAGRPARYQCWNWTRDEPGEWRAVPAAVPVIAEGVSSTRAELGIAWDVQIWVDAPRDVRLRRARERDGSALLHRWLEDWMPSEERYAAREQPELRADLVVSGVAHRRPPVQS